VKKKRLLVGAGVVRVMLRETRLRIVVVHVILRVIRVRFPIVAGIVEAIPDLDLHDDAPLGRPLEEVLEPPPVFLVPLIEVVLAAFQPQKG